VLVSGSSKSPLLGVRAARQIADEGPFAGSSNCVLVLRHKQGADFYGAYIGKLNLAAAAKSEVGAGGGCRISGPKQNAIASPYVNRHKKFGNVVSNA
jgi:hypothetical protein